MFGSFSLNYIIKEDIGIELEVPVEDIGLDLEAPVEEAPIEEPITEEPVEDTGSDIMSQIALLCQENRWREAVLMGRNALAEAEAEGKEEVS